MNGEETTVNEENYLFYTYYNYPELFDEYDYFFVGYTAYNKRYEVFFSDYKWYSTATETKTYSYSYSSSVPYYVVKFDKTLTTITTSSNSTYSNYNGPNIENVIYSNYDITNKNNEIVFTANITKDDLKNIGSKPIYKITYYVNNELYQTIEVEEGTSHNLLDYSYNSDTHIFSGWQYDETLDFSNITSDIIINATLEKKDVIPVYIEFPINKNEFYTLLVEVGVLIMIIFLKWCFPFKGGSDLR